MADSITLDALMQSKGHTALQVQKPASVEAVRAQVEELSPEQKARVEEVKNSIDLIGFSGCASVRRRGAAEHFQLF